MGKISHIVIHNSESLFGCVPVIDKWHKKRGWKGCGYNYVIPNGNLYATNNFMPQFDGTVEVGRYENGDDYLNGDEIGAHALGMNSYSLGICMIGLGIETFTKKQMISLFEKVHFLMHKHNIPIENVIGHYESEYANGKTCPNMDMVWFREQLEGYGIGA